MSRRPFADILVGRIIPTPRWHGVDGQGDATENDATGNGVPRSDAIRATSDFGSDFPLGLRLGVYDIYLLGSPVFMLFCLRRGSTLCE